MPPGTIDEAWKRANSVLDSVNRIVPPRQRALASFLVALAFLIAYRFLPDRSILWTAGSLLVLAVLNVLALKSRSRIAPGRTDTFLIARKHLRGRDEDVRRLVRIVESNPLIFLTGESGSGKSAVLEQGVVPTLTRDPALVPILVDNWGPDWVQGPELAVEIALRRTLSEGDLVRCGWSPNQDQGLTTVLERMKPVLGRTPLLIFDQFDDYQAQHRGRFVRRSVVISAGALRRTNPFWESIAGLLDRRLIRCLFATREDASLQLESVRFCRPTPYILALADAFIARDLIAEIAASGAVEQPENGWNQLAPRILRDLEAGHSARILPIQMVRALQGLIELPSLTVRDYERRGGLSGVEASYLQSRLKEVTQIVGWEESILLGLLSSFVVDNKTAHQKENDLLACLPEAASDPTRLRMALDQLEQHKIVRRVISPVDRALAWRLDHDYIRYSIRELVRRMNRLEEELRDAQGRWEGATGLWQRFRALVPPSRQIRLFWEAFRGRFRYGPAAAYARWSALRLVFNTWIAALLAIGVLWDLRADNQAHEEARGLLRRSENYTHSFSDTQWTEWDKTVWEIANSSLRVRRWILRETLSDMEAGEGGFFPSSPHTYATSLIFGLSLDEREKVAEPVLKERCDVNRKLSNGLVNACASWISSFGSTPDWVPEFLLRQMRYRQNDVESQFEDLATDLAGLDRAPPSAMLEAGHMLVKRLSLAQSNPLLVNVPAVAPNPTDYPQQTVAALTLFGERLSTSDRNMCATFLKDKLSHAQTWLDRSRIADAIKPFAGNEPLEREAEKTVEELNQFSQDDIIKVAPELCAVSGEIRSKVAAYLIESGKIPVIQAVADKCFAGLRPLEAEKAAGVLETNIQDPQALAVALVTLDPPEPSHYRPVAARLADAICSHNMNGQPDSLAQSLATLGNRAPDDTVTRAGECLGQAIQQQLKVGPRLKRVQTRGGKVIPAMTFVVDQRWSDIEKLVNALVALGVRVKPENEKIASALVDESAKVPDGQLTLKSDSTDPIWELAPIIQNLEPVAKDSDLERYGFGIAGRFRNAAVSLDRLAHLLDRPLDQRFPAVVDSAAATLLQRLRDAAAVPNAAYDSGVTDDARRIVEALEKLPRISDAVADQTASILIGWREQTPDSRRSELTAGIFHIARGADPKVNAIASAYADGLMKQGIYDENGATMERAAELMDPVSRRKLLRNTSVFFKNLPVPKCGLLAPLATAEDLPALFDVLKWPTCHDSIGSGESGGRSLLEARVSELLGMSKVNEQSSADQLTTVPATLTTNQELTFLKAAQKWARENRYDLAAPVSPPPPAL